MRFSLIAFLLFLSLTPTSWAGKCSLEKFFSDPALRNNTEFWLQIDKLKQEGKYNDFNVQKLIEKFGGKTENSPGSASNIAPKKSTNISLKKEAQKDVQSLSPALKKHFDEFLDIVAKPEGIQELYKNPGRWHLEDISENSQEKVMSVRLNGGYRVKFAKSEGNIVVQIVDKGKVHDHKK